MAINIRINGEPYTHGTGAVNVEDSTLSIGMYENNAKYLADLIRRAVIVGMEVNFTLAPPAVPAKKE